MSKKPIYLSVVLSTYNDEKYIAASIQSILNQSYPYFEFIIVNDGSNDSTLDIIKSFDDPRIVLIDKPNTGLIDSLNNGVRVAKYDWIARMDGDDVAEANRFEEEVKVLADNVAVVCSQCNVIDSSGLKIGRTKFPSSHLGVSFYINTDFNFPIAHPSVVFNKAMWEKAGGYDPLMLISEDKDMWIKMFKYGDLVMINKPLLNLRKHGGNISTTKSEIQSKNSWVAYLKHIYNVRRSLNSREFEEICNTLVNSSTFKTITKHVGANKLVFMIDLLIKNIYSRCNPKMFKLMRKLPKD